MTDMKHLLIAILTACRLTSFACALGHPDSAAPAVSMVRLIATPEQFTGKRVQTCGWLAVNISDKGAQFTLYLSRQSFDYSESTEAIALDVESLAKILPEPRSIWIAFNGEYVRLQGTFEWTDPKGEHDVQRRITKIESLWQQKPGTPIFEGK